MSRLYTSESEKPQVGLPVDAQVFFPLILFLTLICHQFYHQLSISIIIVIMGLIMCMV